MTGNGNDAKRWSIATHGLAVLAAGAGLGAAADAEAMVILTPVEPDALIVENVGAPFGIDFNSDSVVDITLTSSTSFGSVFAKVDGPATSAALGGPVAAGNIKPFSLDAGAPIGPASEFLAVPQDLGSIEWPGGTNAYLGVSFDIGGQTHFGWAHLQTVGFPNTSITLFDYAYCDQPGQGLLAGQTSGACFGAAAVPLPASLALLAAGAVGMLALRNRGNA